MKKLWKYIEKKNWPAEKKYRFALLLFGCLFALIGFALWLIVQNFALSSWDWMICFIAYPLMLSWIMVFLFSCKYAFHDGEAR
ncbi:MAG: hypothetical protein Q4E53_00405 [Eubacteriales bacterium]|nr:hypothetical protein [Eubacteriales bacterium]